MYLVAIHVPIYLDGDEQFVTTEWKKSLELLRDSFGGRFGHLAVLAPSRDLATGLPEQALEQLDVDSDGISLHSSIPEQHQARHYWFTYRRQWLQHCRDLIGQADVVHSGLDDVFRPMAYDAWRLADRMGKPTVFVQDTDTVLQNQELAAQGSWKLKTKLRIYNHFWERWCRRGVSRADLSLLKGQSLHRRYGRFARNGKNFHNTSYMADQIVSVHALQERTQSLGKERPLKFVYCGRLISRKGVDDSIRIIAEARKLGANVSLDLIGDGEERQRLEQLVSELAVGDVVRFLGAIDYGPELFKQLRVYDGLLFTPVAEDTPRMIFDGYSACLPLVATDIDYVKERSIEESAVVLLPQQDILRAARRLHQVDANRGELADLANKAHEAAIYHSADNWYRRRAEWTVEAVEKHEGR
jgi:glycosyltransferase involved in cell wall biosynthesis